MAQNSKDHQQSNSHESAKANSKSQNNTNANSSNNKNGTPMIVSRVNRIPLVNFAVSMGFSQYDKLKSSNVTVGDVMVRAEGWAAYVWEKVHPFVEKFQEPINRADQLACNTLDFVGDRLTAMKIL